MDPQTVPPAATRKLPYEPPKAAFVPLQVDERLFSSFQPVVPPNCGFPPIAPPNCLTN
jgi:hypothetical protein